MYIADGENDYEALASGTIKLTLRWVDANGQPNTTDPPPRLVVVTQSCEAIATGTQSNGSTTDEAVLVVSNGLGTPVDTSAFGKREADGSRKTVINNVDANGIPNTLIELNAISVKASSIITKHYGATGPYENGDVWAQVRYQFDVANRDLALTRDGAIGETRDANGTVRGHTTYSYTEYTRETTTGFEIPHSRVNWQLFRPGFSGSWSLVGYMPDVTWSWSPAGGSFSYPDTQDRSWQQMPFGSPYKDVNGKWAGEPSPRGMTHSVTYTATDNQDNSTLTAKYILTLHDEYEKKSHSVTDLFENPRRASENLMGPGSVGGERNVEVSYSLSIGAAGALSDWMAKVLNLNLQVSASNTYTAVSTVSANITGNKYTWLEVWDHYYLHTGEADVWAPGGYVGEEPYSRKEIPKNELDRTGIRIHQPFQDYDIGSGGNGGGG